jgi:hypothetical protein
MLQPCDVKAKVLPDTIFQQDLQTRFNLEDFLRFLTGGTLDTAGPGDVDDFYTGGNITLLEPTLFFDGFWDLTAFALEAQHDNELRLFSGEGNPGTLFRNSDVEGDTYTAFGTFALVNFSGENVDPNFFDNTNSVCGPEFLNASIGGIQFWEIGEDVSAQFFDYLPDTEDGMMGLRETGLVAGDIVAGFNDCFAGDADFDDLIVVASKRAFIPVPTSAIIFAAGLLCMVGMRSAYRS